MKGTFLEKNVTDMFNGSKYSIYVKIVSVDRIPLSY